MLIMYTCPVCGYNRLRYPPDDYTICPSCGTQFGYTDANVSHAQLLREWLLRGHPWHSNVTPPPPGWNYLKQLENLPKRASAGGEFTAAVGYIRGSLSDAHWYFAQA